MLRRTLEMRHMFMFPVDGELILSFWLSQNERESFWLSQNDSSFWLSQNERVRRDRETDPL
jgi:hypothetical protein